MVRWLYNSYHWQFFESWHKSVLSCLDSQKIANGSWVIGFVAFDTYKSLLADENGKVSGPGNVIAGFGAGVTESLFAVTPFESIKTQLCVSPSLISGDDLGD